jgi:hypothetical protein
LNSLSVAIAIESILPETGLLALHCLRKYGGRANGGPEEQLYERLINGYQNAMCFVLYAGTNRPLARRRWQKDAPDMCVVSLPERDAPIKAHFSSPEVQFIGSTSRCGCDFPKVMLQNGEWPLFEMEPDAEREASDRYNRQALVDLLRGSREKVVELYGLPDNGDLTKTPQAREEISAKRILDPDFYFKEQGF